VSGGAKGRKKRNKERDGLRGLQEVPGVLSG